MKTLSRTLPEVRELQLAQVGKVGRPNPWWVWSGGSDCMAAQTTLLGLRTNPRDQTPHLISIAAFRTHFGWNEVPIDQVRAGDLICEWWPERTGEAFPSRPTPRHIEWLYSVDHDEGLFRTTSANTGPAPGDADPNGFWRKTRAHSRNLLFGIRPPYKDERASLARKAFVKRTAAYLNATMPHAKDLPRTKAADKGIEDSAYRRLVQTWGASHDEHGKVMPRARAMYGPGFRIDGVFGPRSRQVEAVVGEIARRAK